MAARAERRSCSGVKGMATDVTCKRQTWAYGAAGASRVQGLCLSGMPSLSSLVLPNHHKSWTTPVTRRCIHIPGTISNRRIALC